MAREYARRLVSTWRDKDFTALDLEHQGFFDALCASPDLSRVGVIPWMPERLSKCSDGLTAAKVVKLTRQLHERSFVVLDRECCELLVRSHIRYDNVLGVPNVSKSMARAYDLVISPIVSATIVRELARLWVENPKQPGWKVIPEVNPTLWDEVLQHPISEGIEDA